MTSEMRSNDFVISVPFLELACSWKNATTFSNQDDSTRAAPRTDHQRPSSSTLRRRSLRSGSKKFSGNFRDARRHGGANRGREEIAPQLLEGAKEIIHPRIRHVRNRDLRVGIDDDLPGHAVIRSAAHFY